MFESLLQMSELANKAIAEISEMKTSMTKTQQMQALMVNSLIFLSIKISNFVIFYGLQIKTQELIMVLMLVIYTLLGLIIVAITSYARIICKHCFRCRAPTALITEYPCFFNQADFDEMTKENIARIFVMSQNRRHRDQAWVHLVFNV